MWCLTLRSLCAFAPLRESSGGQAIFSLSLLCFLWLTFICVICVICGFNPFPCADCSLLKFQAPRYLARNQGTGQVYSASRGEAKAAQRTSARARARLHIWVHQRDGST